jgi:hypothetical protein
VCLQVEEDNIDAAEAAELEEMSKYVTEDELRRDRMSLSRVTDASLQGRTALSGSTMAALAETKSTRTLGKGVPVVLPPAARRVSTTMSALSGAAGAKYMEYTAEVSGAQALKEMEAQQEAEKRARAAQMVAKAPPPPA